MNAEYLLALKCIRRHLKTMIIAGDSDRKIVEEIKAMIKEIRGIDKA